MSVLVYVENTDGSFKKSIYELLSYGKALAERLQTSLTAISIGNVPEETLQDLGKYGVEKVLNVQSDALNQFINTAYAAVIAEAAGKSRSDVVLLSNSFSGKGLAPRIAAKLGAAYADGAVALPELKDGNLLIRKTAFSGKAFATTELQSEKKVISLNPNAYQVVENPVEVTLENFSPDVPGDAFKTMVRDIVRAKDKVTLADADIVVSAGRGLKGPENWGLIEELADALGAATACSKPVSDAGWRPHEEHVGQTGISISPNLYIAVGISGAIQHLAGVSASKTIVVINKDPEAPFFKVADYGIVGDAFQVLPKLTAAIKAYKAG